MCMELAPYIELRLCIELLLCTEQLPCIVKYEEEPDHA